MISLTPQTEARLREKAERDGTDIDETAEALLRMMLDWEEQEAEATVAGIQRGLQAVSEGRERPFSEYVADVKRRRQVRDAQNRPEVAERAA